MMNRRLLIVVASSLMCITESTQARQTSEQSPRYAKGALMPPIALKAARVWDGVALTAHDGWIVIIRGELIEAVGPAAAGYYSQKCPRD